MKWLKPTKKSVITFIFLTVFAYVLVNFLAYYYVFSPEPAKFCNIDRGCPVEEPSLFEKLLNNYFVNAISLIFNIFHNLNGHLYHIHPFLPGSYALIPLYILASLINLYKRKQA